MKSIRFAALCSGVALLASGWSLTTAFAQVLSSNTSVFVTGLNNPRGLRFGPNGDLYVAEGGIGGSISTEGQCIQVVPPIGPYTGGFNSRISKIDRTGVRTTVVDQLPSDQTSPGSGAFVSGVADVQFIGTTLYALLAGAGCSHGLINTTNGVIRVEKDGHWRLVADLSAFQKKNPVANPNPGDFEPDGTWFSMVSVGDLLFAMEPNHGELDLISPFGLIRRISDISASEGHIVPTSVVFHDGYFYFGNLGLFPIVPGSSNVYRLDPFRGTIEVFASGFTTIEGITFDRRGRLYVLESMTAPGLPGPGEAGTGTIVRVDHHGVVESIATGLSFPTAMTFGSDSKLYVSNFGFAVPPGTGQIVRVDLPQEDY